MRTFLVLLISMATCICTPKMSQTKLKKFNLDQNQCIADQQMISTFRIAFDAFAVNLLKAAARRGSHFIALSPHSVWLTLAAIAEGADKETQKDLFKLLNLPKNACSRQKFYQVATTRLNYAKNTSIFHTRVLLVDNGVYINPRWYESIRNHSLLQIVAAPMKHDPVMTISIIKNLMLRNHQLNFNGNSILLNSIEYNGLWTDAFSGATIERSPFYSHAGQQIGSVDLMKFKKTVRTGYVASINSKILELSIGTNGEFRMIFALVVDNDPNIEPMVSSLSNYTILEMIASLQDSNFPIDVAIPLFMMNSEIDMKRVLEDMGVVNLWQDPGATWFISTPPALPRSYIQHTALTLINSEEIQPPLVQQSWEPASDEERYWGEFVADRPFMFALVDSQTYTSLLVAMYSKPTYSY